MDNSVPRTLGKIKRFKAPTIQKFTVMGQVRWGQEIHTYVNHAQILGHTIHNNQKVETMQMSTNKRNG